MNYLFNLNILEHLLPIQLEAVVCRKLCDKFQNTKKYGLGWSY